MKFNLGEKVRIKSNGIIGIIIARGYNEYLDENDKQQSFEEYQIEADKYYQCNEDEIELITDVTIESLINKIKEITSVNENCEKKLKNVKVINKGRVTLGLNEEGNMIKERKCCGNCCEFDKSTGICEYNNIAVCRDSGICEEYYPEVQEINVGDNNDLVNPFMEEYERIVTDTMSLCKKKNKDYGSSVQDTYQKFGDISYLTRITDKYNRICSLMSKDNEVEDESILDSIKDMGNYCFLWSASKSLDDR